MVELNYRANGPVEEPAVTLEAFLDQSNATAVRIEAGDDVRLLAPYIDRLRLVEISFPRFRDGRGYSAARILREEMGYTGELRAIGDVLRDQLFSMQRCGFNAFATRQDRSIEDALKGLTVFSEVYQASVDQDVPLFRRVERHVKQETPAGADVGYGI